MSTAKAELARAQSEFKEAMEAVAREQREEDKTALRKATAEGREAKQEFDRLEREFHRAEMAASVMQSRMVALLGAIAEQEHRQPDPLDFPSDEELATWNRELNQLMAQRNTLAEAVRNAEFVKEQARLAGIRAGSQVQRLRQVVANLRSKIADPETFGGGFPPGGLSRV